MKKIVFYLMVGILLLSSCQDDNLSVDDKIEQEFVSEQGRRSLWLIKSVGQDYPMTKAVGIKGKYWNPGDTIRIKFLGVEEAIQNKIKQYAAEWLEYASVYFEYVDSDQYADVKISFGTENGRWISWSAIGTDCKAVPQNEPSLTYFWWEDDQEAVIKSEILKGIGLVLGLGFEHQNPASTLAFKPAADIAGYYNLSEDEAEQFRMIYTTDQTNYTEYDKSSVMMVTIGRELTVRPNQATNYNSELSENDKEFVKNLYPPLLITATFVKELPTFFIASHPWIVTNKQQPTRSVDWGDGSPRQKLLKDDWYDHLYRDKGEHVVRIFGHDTSCICFGTTYNSDNGQIKSLDVSGAKELQALLCNDGYLTKLDVSHNTKLTMLVCRANPYLRQLVLSNCPLLETVECNECSIEALDFSQCPELKIVRCGGNALRTLDFSKNPKLDFLSCSGLSVLNLSNNPALKLLGCTNGNLTYLDVSSCTALESLSCQKNRISNLVLGANPNLETLNCTDNAQGLITRVAPSLPLREGKKAGLFYINDSTELAEVAVTCLGRNWTPRLKSTKIAAYRKNTGNSMEDIFSQRFSSIWEAAEKKYGKRFGVSSE